MIQVENGIEYLWIKIPVSELKGLETALTGVRVMPDEDDGAIQKNTYSRITDILRSIGVPAHIKGYYFIRKAILLAVEDEAIMNAVTNRLYPEIAKECGTAPSRVERAIRHAIETAWDRGNQTKIHEYFGYSRITDDSSKPTNSEFIAAIADKIRLERM